jgi:hypothetical protein
VGFWVLRVKNGTQITQIIMMIADKKVQGLRFKVQCSLALEFGIWKKWNADDTDDYDNH